MSELLAKILYGINSVIHSYGWSMIIFTLVVKLLIMPLDYKSRKGMRRMSAIQPEMMRLQKKYENDKEKLNRKVAELYRREGVSPTSGCLPMLISMVILWVMWGAMRTVADTELINQCVSLLVNGNAEYEGFLWIKNIWMPDSPFAPTIANQSSLAMITAEKWATAFAALGAEEVAKLAALGIDATNFGSESVLAALQTLPVYAEQTQLWSFMPHLNLILANLSIYASNNGWFILPVLSAVTQFLMTQSQPQQPAANGQQNSTNTFMKYFFPLFSLWICSSYNALFSLYWVVSNIFAWIQSVVMNKMFEKMDKAEKATAKEGTVK